MPKLRVVPYCPGLFFKKVEKLEDCRSAPEIMSRKEVIRWSPNVTHSPSKQHPWKKYGCQIKRERMLRAEIRKNNNAMV